MFPVAGWVVVVLAAHKQLQGSKGIEARPPLLEDPGSFVLSFTTADSSGRICQNRDRATTGLIFMAFVHGVVLSVISQCALLPFLTTSPLVLDKFLDLSGLLNSPG